MKSPLCVFLLYSIIFPSIGVELGLKAQNPKLTNLNLQSRCLFYHLTLKEESAPIMKPSRQIPQAFYQHGIAEKTKMI